MANEPEGYMSLELFFSNRVHFFIDHYQLKAHNSHTLMALRRRWTWHCIIALEYCNVCIDIDHSWKRNDVRLHERCTLQ